MPNSLRFQRSITQELEVVKNRVRDLIGSANWPEEGRYKESILIEAINTQLPQQISTGTGFIVRKDENSEDFDISKQHDIILYDNRMPVLLRYGDFIVTTPRNVMGVIEVKSNLSPSKFREVFKKLEDSLEKILDNFNKKFIGVFSYDFLNKTTQNLFNIENQPNITNTLKKSKGIINHISLGEKYFVRFWEQHQGTNLDPVVNSDTDFYNIYKLDNLSYSYFISNVLHRTCENLDDRYWHSFPIIDTKESHRLKTIKINQTV